MTHNGPVSTPRTPAAGGSAEAATSPTAAAPAAPAEPGQRQRILDTALRLMAQRGMTGTSMRDLATATGLNVASLYHYFPSKRDLLVAVLEERGYLDDLTVGPGGGPGTGDELERLLADLLRSMLDVEEFIRLMLGEAIRGDDTAISVGTELMAGTLGMLERELMESAPELCQRVGATSLARMLRALVIGTFFEHVVGVMEGPDPATALRRRAVDAARILRAE